MDVIPAIDLLEGRVVRLQRGDYDRVTSYSDDPVSMARSFGEAGAHLVHVVDLGGARSGEADPTIWVDMVGSGVAIQVGGGIRTVELAVAALDAGVERVVAGSAAVWSPDLLAAMAARVGSGRLVAAIDVRQGRALGAGWRDEGRPVDEVIANVIAAGVEWVLVTSITGDGMMSGPDIPLLEMVAAAGVGVIASGGVGTLSDLEAIAATGVGAAVVGRALYERRFTLGEAIAATQER